MTRKSMPFTTEQKFIARTQEALHRRLPVAYIDRMLRSNGGTLECDGDEWVMHPIFDDSDRKRLARTCNDIVRETKSAREWASFPPSAVAIGANGSGDMLVFLVENDERFGDAVYIWEHETGQIRQVASSVEVLTDRGMDEPRPNKPLKKLSDFG